MADVSGKLESASLPPSNDRELTSLNYTARSSSTACAAPCAMVRQGTRTSIRFHFTFWARREPRSLRKAFGLTVGSLVSPVTREQIHLLNQVQMKSTLRCWCFCRVRMALKLRRCRNLYLKRSPRRRKTFAAKTQRNPEIEPSPQIPQSATRNPQSSEFIW